MASSGKFDQPTKYCDLVMKGGIASGVVYPAAVLELAQDYRFCGIGGTSVGAIAAAVTAAAEFGRDSGGFERLAALSEWLATDGHIAGLFQPDAEVKPAMDAVLALTAGEPTPTPGARGVGRLARLLRGLAGASPGGADRGRLVGLAAGLIAAALLSAATAGVLALAGDGPTWAGFLAPFGVLLVALGSLGAYFGGPLGAAWQLGQVAGAFRARGFGLCSGRTVGAAGAPPALTDWLEATLDHIAGLPPGPPLTFGMIRAGGDTEHARQLAMMTTDLSHQAPWRLPFDKNIFLFHEEELRALFSDRVVRHMVEHAHRTDRVRLPEGYHFLPEPDELPVVFAARLSLSLPLVFRAVRLYTVGLDAYRRRKQPDGTFRVEAADLQECWFSDGGIVSNFPIHLFDDWLPSWPTFGINLGALPAEAFQEQPDAVGPEALAVRPSYQSGMPGGESIDEPPPAVAEELDVDAAAALAAPTRPEVELPPANGQVTLDWAPIDGLGDLASAIFYTAKNHRETIQATLPGYRERIVQIRLTQQEGGMNLDMPAERVRQMLDKGRRAGQMLRHDFNFDYHRWVRLRVLMAQLEGNLRKLESVFEEHDYQQLIRDALKPENQFPYRRRPARWSDAAIRAFESLAGLVDAWKSPVDPDRPLFDDEQIPRPLSTLRVTPRD